MRRLFWIGAVLIAAVAVFMPAPDADADPGGARADIQAEHRGHVQRHLDAGGAWGWPASGY